MKTKSVLSLSMLAVTSTLYMAQPVAAEPWSYHSAVCEAITPAQSERLEWRENGLFNKDPQSSLWVMCPMPIKTDNNNDVNFGVAVGNDSDSTADVYCILRVYNEDGKLKSYSHTLTIAPGEVGVKTWDVDDEAFWPAIQCDMPPNTVLRGLEARY